MNNIECELKHNLLIIQLSDEIVEADVDGYINHLSKWNTSSPINRFIVDCSKLTFIEDETLVFLKRLLDTFQLLPDSPTILHASHSIRMALNVAGLESYFQFKDLEPVSDKERPPSPLSSLLTQKKILMGGLPLPGVALILWTLLTSESIWIWHTFNDKWGNRIEFVQGINVITITCVLLLLYYILPLASKWAHDAKIGVPLLRIVVLCLLYPMVYTLFKNDSIPIFRPIFKIIWFFSSGE